MNAPRLALLVAFATACGARSELNVAAPLDDVAPADIVNATPDVIDVVDVADAPDVIDVIDVPDVGDVPDVIDAFDAGPDVQPPICGNGVREAAEECDLGARNALLPAFALSQPGRPEVPVQPVARRSSGVTFYHYDSASAHTGFELVDTANVFLYVDSTDDDLGLFFFAGRDGDDGSTPVQGSGDMDVFFRGMPLTAFVALSDDAGELTRPVGGDPHGRWTFQQNSDGCVFTRMPWDAPWRVVIEGTYRAGVTSIRYVDRDGRLRPLVLRDAVVLEHRSASAMCRPDCRVPRCGDGYVDGGERCDDGNTRSGDGCAADCQRIE